MSWAIHWPRYKLNWSKTSGDKQKLFESWKKGKFTIFGQECVVNSLAISQLNNNSVS